jgi:hypothetical protein
MPEHLRQHLAQNQHMPGIIVMNSRMRVSEMIDDLILLWLAAEESEFADQIVYLPVR